MDHGFVTRRRVEFIDTDMAGIVHFAAYFRYVETAEHELFHSLGFPIAAADSDRKWGWPRVSCSFDYDQPLRFPDDFEVHLGVARLGRRSITYAAEIVRDGQVLARGTSTCVYCELGPDQQMQSADIPEEIAEALSHYRMPEAEGT